MPKYEHRNGWTKDLPKRLKIGNLIYALEIMDYGQERESSRFGECVNNDQVIRLGPTMKRQKARDTLMHEVLHALLWCYEIKAEKEGGEEHLCSMLPMALDQFRQTNPKAWRFIYPKKKRGK